MGAIIGGAFAATRDASAVETRVHEVLGSEAFGKSRLKFLKETKEQKGGLFFSVANLVRRGIFFGLSNLRESFISAEEIAHSLEAIIPDVQIEELDRPFGAVALDLQSADEVLLRSGSLRAAALASSAIPGVLPPSRWNERLLIDGGWVDKIPVLPAFLLGADVVIAVDISADLQEARDYRRGADIMVRANSIKDAVLVGQSRRMADMVLEPRVRHVHWADFSAYRRCIEAGDEAVTEALPRIRELLGRERWLSIIRPGRGYRFARMRLRAGDGLIHVE
jgi:NTE family protein